MKKSLLIATAVFTGSLAFGQELTSKKGFPILPETGDYSIGIDATPFLEYFGKIFSNGGSNAPTWNFLNSTQTIVGKKMIDEKTAYRGIVRIGFSSTKQKAMISDATVTTPPTFPELPKMVEDKQTVNSNFIGLGAGLEKRRGNGRLQGIYGADLLIWSQGGKSKYEYGNALSASGTVVVANFATTTDFGSNNLTTDTYGNGARMTEAKSGRSFGVGVRAFVGCEFFIAPKISLGAEFGWGLGFQSVGSSVTTTESVGGAGPSVGVQEIESGKSSSLILDVDRNAFGTGNGALKLNFYF
jgi:hypothetical protein